METIVCIPGLGGRANLFSKYKGALSEYNLEFVDVINWKKAQDDIDQMIEKHEKVIFFCNCYGMQFALRTIEKNPSKISALVVIEPYLGEFLSWRKIAIVINWCILAIMNLTDRLGIKRTKFPEVDYNWVEKQPLYLQPFYDIWHQSMTDYFEKIDDILKFELPSHVDTKTFFIFSPKGYIRDPKKRERLKNVFPNAELVELGKNSHNIMTLSYDEIATAIKNWLKLNVIK